VNGQVTRLIERHPIVAAGDLDGPATGLGFGRRNAPNENLVARIYTLVSTSQNTSVLDVTALNKRPNPSTTEALNSLAKELVDAQPGLIAVDHKASGHGPRLPAGGGHWCAINAGRMLTSGTGNSST
jgi:hypothetical protein